MFKFAFCKEMRTNSRSAKCITILCPILFPLILRFSRLLLSLVTNALQDPKKYHQERRLPLNREMSLLEAIIIYLSAGAPFGVLVLFSQKSVPAPMAASNALLATLAWPIFGTYRLYRGLYRRRNAQIRADSDVTTLQVLQGLSREIPTDAAELFEIAGHSNPWVATNCYARARKKVIESHIDRISKVSMKSRQPSISLSNEPVISPKLTTTVGT